MNSFIERECKSVGFLVWFLEEVSMARTEGTVVVSGRWLGGGSFRQGEAKRRESRQVC